MRTEVEVTKLAEKFARRLDIETPKVRMVASKGRSALRVHLSGGQLRVPEACLEELTEGELSFAIALAFARHVHLDLWAIPALVVPWGIGFSVGYLTVGSFRDELGEHFWGGYAILAVCTGLGYLVGLALAMRNQARVRDQVFAEALTLTGSPHAAEAYLIRSQAGDLSTNRRRTLSSKDKDFLATQLEALAHAARSLGIDYRSVTEGP